MRKYEIYSVEGKMYKANDKAFPGTFVFKIRWSANIGFGELTFFYNQNENKWDVDNECMGKEFCEAVLSKWLENIQATN